MISLSFAFSELCVYCWTLSRSLLARLNSDVLSESMYLIQDHLAHLSYILDNLEIEIEGGWAPRFVRGIMPDL